MAIYTGSNKHLGGTETVTRKQEFYYGLIQTNVLVTGSNGQLGHEISAFTERHHMPFHFLFTDADTLDVTDAGQLASFVKDRNIRYIVNCAAYTAVDRAETDVEEVYKVNYKAVENIAYATKDTGAKIIHISTDYVFDGHVIVPYREDHIPNPLSVYGKSKLKGEEALRQHADNWMIIRTSWLFSEFGTNFVKTMIRLMTERDELNIVADQKGTPTYAADLAEMILYILQFSEEKEWKSGIYHFSNKGETTWFGFAEKIKELIGIETCRLLPIRSNEYKAVAERPSYGVLDLAKIRSVFQIEIPSWEDALERCIKRIQNNY